ncbi:MAG: hypothetical protein HYY04_00695 [Chloroflexi bacterium]|nr:hypothetical protein [Chloroflexota bacterium]
MNDQERFVRTMHFQSVDRVPFWPTLGHWSETVARWRDEGLPATIAPDQYFAYGIRERAPVNFRFVPPFESRVVRQTEEHVYKIDDEGVLKVDRRDNWELSMPHFLEFPVKTREDFHALKFRMDPDSPARFPPGWRELCARWRTRQHPLHLMGDRVGGFFGPLRGMMGLEALSVTFFDDPVLIEEMMDAKTALMMGLIEKALADTTIDYFAFWEDMAYTGGPLLSPAMFKRYMVPRYRKVTDLLRSKGVDTIFVDSDGNVDKLIPLWIEAGVNGNYPLEVQSGMDPVALRKKYGRDLVMWGGLDKKVLRLGRQEIEQEVMTKVPWLLEQGGYIPGLDHSVPPDVPFANFCYYIELLWKVIEG